MSRLNDLIRRAATMDPRLGDELAKEVGALTDRRSFGLVFEPHLPEAVALPGRPVRRGDKVRLETGVVTGRASAKLKQEQEDAALLWQVVSVRRDAATGQRMAELVDAKGQSREGGPVPVDALTVFAEFGDEIYPGLKHTGEVIGADPDGPHHAVITAENSHALELMGYTHRGKFDAIYLDPPYNTGAKDWKYNNDYVGGDDLYRHSKWLAFMERRLQMVKPLLNPENSVLIVTIDEKEFLRLGLLLEQTFPEARIQMVSSLINPAVVARAQAFGRTDEYVFFVMFGDAGPSAQPLGEEWIEAKTTVKGKLHWAALIRTGTNTRREDSFNQFYPIFVRNTADGPVVDSVGESYYGDDRSEVAPPEGCDAIWPIRRDGSEGNWQNSRDTLLGLIEKGYVRLGRWRGEKTAVSYLKRGEQKKVEAGFFPVTGHRADGSVIVDESQYVPRFVPGTQWRIPSHDASRNGSNLLRALMPDRKFPFPKSLYAVEDALRFFVSDKPDALVMDCFGGSGTTLHAVMRLNAEDGGRRRAVLVSNNDVSTEEEKALRAAGHIPGDPEWEALGICDYITKPRVKAAITGLTPAGEPIKGGYKYNREADLADGLEQNAQFFTLTYEDPKLIRHGRAFDRIAPVLWLRAGQVGPVIDAAALGSNGWAVNPTYGVITDMAGVSGFLEQVQTHEPAEVFVITDDDAAFARISAELPVGTVSTHLYENYLQNFRINRAGDLALCSKVTAATTEEA